MNSVRAGKTPRTSYHHGDLANALTEAATQMARDGGPEAVVLREAARKVGVSATAAYRHFAGHGDLIHAVKACAQEDLATAMQAELSAARPLADPKAEAVRRLSAIGIAYIRFALAEPGLFRTAFTRFDRATAQAMAEQKAAGMVESPAFRMLAETLDRLVEVGLMSPHLRPDAEIFAWSCAHGLAMLLLDGPLAALPDDIREDAIQNTMRRILDGLIPNRG
jgi:AcrR family transcriptional regulator